MSNVHPEFEIEQGYIRAAYEEFKRHNEDLQRQPEAAADMHTARSLRKYADSTLDSRSAESSFCAGRIDMIDGEVRYVGKHSVLKETTPLIISWRAKKAKPFYEARRSDPQSVRMRRRFSLDDQIRLLDIKDEILMRVEQDQVPQAVAEALVTTTPSGLNEGNTAAPSESAGEPLMIEADGARDAILEEMELARSAEMRDIVATIQADQFEQISDGIDGVLAIQGGPGTGKTAVLLHRAAYLLYNYSEQLTGPGVLVVGPNRAFMGYVARVLPSLGETQVDQSTIHHLVSSVRAKQPESDPRVARVKGDLRMAEVVRRAIDNRIRVPENGLKLNFKGRDFHLPASDIRSLVELARPTGPYSVANRKFRRDMIALAFQRYLDAGTTQPAHAELGFQEAMSRTREWRNALERFWPTVSAVEVVRDLLDSKTTLERASEGILSDEERALLERRRTKAIKDEPWTYADLPLIDEAHAVLDGVDYRYGYVLADEAQDLSPMQLRMLGRRAIGGRITLSGDLAQCTGVWKYSSWDEIGAALGVDSELRVREMVYAYRVPSPVMDLASRLLPEIAPHINAPEPVRGGSEPKLVETTTHDLATAVVVEYLNLMEEERTCGIVAPESLHASIRNEFERELIVIGDSVSDGLKRRVTLISPELVKGLEFDHVIVVEPKRIAAEKGLAALYVAMTRPTRNLVLVHSEPLPAPIGGEEETPAAPTTRAPLRSPEPEITTDLSARYSEALMHAKFLHSGQARPGTTTPRFAHLLAVSSMVIEDGGSEHEAIAALLHDSIQHRGRDHLDSIRAQFGDTVAALVEASTDPAIEPGDKWRTYREKRLEELMGAPPSVCRIVLAEKIDNLRSIIRDLRRFGPDIFKREQMPSPEDLAWWFGELATLFKQEHPGSLADELADAFDEFEEAIGKVQT